QSARRTLGGGIVLDPFAPRRQRRAPLRTAELHMLEQGSASRILAGLLETTDQGVDIEAAARNLNLGPAALQQALRDADAVVLGREQPVGITRAAADLLAARIYSALAAHHAAQPQSDGMTLDALRRAAHATLSPKAFEPLAHGLADEGRMGLSHGVARRREHDSTANPVDGRLWRRVRRSLRKCGVDAPLVPELAQRLREPEATMSDFLHRKSRGGEIL